MKDIKKITLDEGYYFGMGVFETIAVENGCPLFLQWHLERMEKGLERLEISKEIFLEQVSQSYILEYLKTNFMKHGVLKLMASEHNIVFSTKKNPYSAKDYAKGFYVGISKVIKNDTSVFNYVKSFHYGDNLIEKRKAQKNGYDEIVFFNTKKQLTETTASNIFLVKEGKLYTPKLECGLLDGVVRRYILEHYDVEEGIIRKEEINEYEEVFLTNSLMGIMPVTLLGEKKFQNRTITMKIKQQYETEIKNREKTQKHKSI